MDLLTGGLMVFGVWIFYEASTLVFNRIGMTRIFNEIGMNNYRVIQKNKNKFSTEFIIDVPTGGSFEQVEEKQQAIEKALSCKVELEDIPYSSTLKLKVVKKDIGFMDYKPLELSNYELLLGHDNEANPIIVNMKKTAHLGVVGLSNSGKTKCIETALKNLKNADIYILNSFTDDFDGIVAERINGGKEILSFLKQQLADKCDRFIPTYIVIDEYNVLSRVKGIEEVIADLLAQCRHYNLYIICIMQNGNKEDCKFKNLFNNRLAFRTIDESTLKAFIGSNSFDGRLNNREFILLSDKLYQGKTFTVRSESE